MGVASTDPSPKAVVGTLCATLAVLVLGIGTFLATTHQGQGLTTESLRQAEIQESPKTLAPLALFDARQQAFDMTQIDPAGRILIIDFVYTRCQTLCVTLGSLFQNLQTAILQQGLENQVALVSISFDPEHDDAQALARYEKRLQMDPRVWQVYSLKNARDRQSLLDGFGIMVIPAPLQEFEHNAAFHIVKQQRLYRIFSIEQATEALLYARALGLQP